MLDMRCRHDIFDVAICGESIQTAQERVSTHCFRVFEKRVGILSAVVFRQDRVYWALKGGGSFRLGC